MDESPIIDIFQGHVLDVLREMASNQFHVCITSPPYWGLRDYKVEPVEWRDGWIGNLGLEPTPSLYVQHLVEICREIKRVLRDDGTFWLNLGDSYTGSGVHPGGSDKQASNAGALASKGGAGLKPKDMVGIPWAIAFALRDDGWWLRMDNVWAKGCSFGEHEVKCPHCGKTHTARYSGSVMPESVRDRPTKGHEYVFLFSKSQRYYYNYYAVKERLSPGTMERYQSGWSGNEDRDYVNGPQNHFSKYMGSDHAKASTGRNVRSVWQINSAQFPEAHYAVFPEDLVEHPIAASTSDSGCCAECEKPWKRANIQREVEQKRKPAHVPNNTDTKVDSTGWEPTTEALDYDEPSCDCSASETMPCLVLDPFGGRGTTAVVAAKHNCDCVLIELSDEYVEMSIRWIKEQIDVPVYVTKGIG